MAAGALRIGISGWIYPPWRGKFYPDGLAQRRELEFASRHVNSIEINGTFYSLKSPKSFAKWRDETPEDFVFAVKGSRFITHMKRLRDIEAPLANFFASGVLALGPKLGPLLWQFPPNFRYERDRLAEFLRLLPRDTEAAAELAGRHDSRVSGEKCLTETDARRPLRHAVEIRHGSFEDEDFISLLRDEGVALVVADTAGKWPLLEDVTADFIYVRLHGDEELYASGYSDDALDSWAARIRSWAGGHNPRGARRIASPAEPRDGGRDVFVYFDNDIKVHAPYDAMGLARRLGLPEPAEFQV